MRKKESSIDDFVFKSNDDLQTEVKKELNRFIRQEKKLSADKEKEIKKESKKTQTFEEILLKQEELIKQDVEKIKASSDLDKVKWVMEKHDSFVDTINNLVRQDFLNGTEYMDRYLIILYMQQLITLLTTYDIEFNNEMTTVLVNEGYTELLSILNVLNYI
jgi:HSP90 family molecular chaperone